MNNIMFRVVTGVSAVSLSLAFLGPFLILGAGFSLSTLIAAFLVAVPFAVAVLGHFLVPRTWPRQVTLALCGLTAWLGWFYTAFMVMWMHVPMHLVGAAHAVLFGVPLALLVLALRYIKVRAAVA